MTATALPAAQSTPPPAAGLNVALVTTCPPRQCGIATFSRDLAEALSEADPSVRIQWAAIDEVDAAHSYGPEVSWRIQQGCPASYRTLAAQLNAAPIDVVHLQHEFGLYGVWGEPFDDHLTGFLRALRKPLVTTFHSVLPAPSPSVYAAVRRLADRSDAVVVMAERARALLLEAYGVSPAAVRVIPHGVPPVEPRGRTRLKEQMGLGDRTIITTFGLVDPRKGLEYMMGAMRDVRRCDPSALYLVIGKTHPELARREGEAYRALLQGLVAAYGLQEHVRFIDEYLTRPQIVDYLLASDVYVTPYLDPKQITSGTLAYALGAGKAIVSTRYLHAVEVLTEQRGLLVDFASETELAGATLRILGDPDLKQRLEHNAYLYGHETTWPRVGARLLEVLKVAAGRHEGLPTGTGVDGPALRSGEPRGARGALKLWARPEAPEGSGRVPVTVPRL